MKRNERIIVDVRMPQEYAAGHARGTINIPLDELTLRLGEIKEVQMPVILCGDGDDRRVSLAEGILKRHHIDCLDAGSWEDVDLFWRMSK